AGGGVAARTGGRLDVVQTDADRAADRTAREADRLRRAGADRARVDRVGRALPGRVLAGLGHARLHRLDGGGDRRQAVVRGLERVDTVGHRVEEVGQLAGTGRQSRRGEEVRRIVEGRVDLLAGGKALLGGRLQRGRVLQREQVCADCSRESNGGRHAFNLSGRVPYWRVRGPIIEIGADRMDRQVQSSHWPSNGG